MKFLVLCSLNLLFWADTVYSKVSIRPQFEHVEYNSVIFKESSSFELKCDVAFTSESGSKIAVTWKRDNKSVETLKGLKDRAKQQQNGNVYSLTVSKAEYSDAGEYTCEAQETDSSGVVLATEQGTIQVGSIIAVKVQTNINVVEEETLKIQCETLGNPPPIISWQINSTSYNGTLFTESADRVKLKSYSIETKNISNGMLIIENINKDDRGWYTCFGQSSLSDYSVNKTAMVRVKDKYAALWPFLCICIEVIILCAIIVIYEKKRNKSELEESDTDQSPDQKNTPDHGKEANLRHRQ